MMLNKAAIKRVGEGWGEEVVRLFTLIQDAIKEGEILGVGDMSLILRFDKEEDDVQEGDMLPVVTLSLVRVSENSGSTDGEV